MRTCRLGMLATFVSIVTMVPSRNANGIVISDFRPDSAYTSLATGFPDVGKFNSVVDGLTYGSGVLIDSQWVLTAGHVTDDMRLPYEDTSEGGGHVPGDSFILGGQSYEASEIHRLWSEDLGLVKLDRAVAGVTPASFYTSAVATPLDVTIVGYGLTGTGTTGEELNTQGTARAAENQIDKVIGGRLYADFDSPWHDSNSLVPGSEFPRTLEGITAHGDSGGGWFAPDGSLVGTHVEGRSGKYGDLSIAVSLIPYISSLNETMSATYKTESLGAFNGNWSESAKWLPDHQIPNNGIGILRYQAIVTNSTVTVDVPTTVYSLSLSSSQLTVNQTLTVDNSVYWPNGSLSGSAHTVVNGLIRIGLPFQPSIGASNPTLINHTLDMFGKAQQYGQLATTFGSIINNKVGATWSAFVTFPAPSDPSLQDGNPIGALDGGIGQITFNNEGLFEVSGIVGHAGSFNVQAIFNNTATVDVHGGRLLLSGPVVQHQVSSLLGGTWIVRDGGALDMTAGSDINLINANVTLSGPTAQFSRLTALQYNYGDFTINQGYHFACTTFFSDVGATTVSDSGSLLSTTTSLGVQTTSATSRATLTVASGGKVSVGGITGIAGGAGSTGQILVTGVSSTLDSAAQIQVGEDGAGVLIIEDEARVHSLKALSPTGTSGLIGGNAGSTGQVTLTGTNSKWTQDGRMVVGFTGSGTLSILNGGTLESVDGAVALNTGTSGTVLVQGVAATWRMTGNLSVGGGATQRGGNGQLTLADGGSVAVAQTMTVWNGSTVQLTGSGQILVGADTSTTAGLHIGPGGKLAGYGTIQGDVYASNGVVSPGSSIGALHVAGSFYQDAGNVLSIEVSGAGSTLQCDQLLVSGTATVNGLLNIDVINSGGAFQIPTIGSEFTILSAGGGVFGHFQNEAALRSLAGYALIQWSLTTESGNDVLKLISISAVPEPTTSFLFIFGSFLVAAFARRCP